MCVLLCLLQGYYPELSVWVSQEPFPNKEMEGRLPKVRLSVAVLLKNLFFNLEAIFLKAELFIFHFNIHYNSL